MNIPVELELGHLDPPSPNNWMTSTPSLDSLSLGELVLPGAHNAGMDKESPNYDIISGNWLTCQNGSFYYQLTNGARAIDLRLGDKHRQADNKRFYFHHNGGESFRYLEELITDTVRFLQENPDEFIVFDFHELTSGNVPFDHKKFNSLLLTDLGNRMIPSNNIHLSLGELKHISHTQRVLVAANPHPDLDSVYFCPHIRHKWSGTALTSVGELYAHIDKVMKSHPNGDEMPMAIYNKRPWSLSATAYGAMEGPVDIKEHLDQWFEPWGLGWSIMCSIINADFFEESNLVNNCWGASRIKALMKIHFSSLLEQHHEHKSRL